MHNPFNEAQRSNFFIQASSSHIFFALFSPLYLLVSMMYLCLVCMAGIKELNMQN